MSTENNWYVEIVETATGKAVKTMGPMSECKADKVDAGASINLNHEEYHVNTYQGDST